MGGHQLREGGWMSRRLSEVQGLSAWCFLCCGLSSLACRSLLAFFSVHMIKGMKERERVTECPAVKNIS